MATPFVRDQTVGLRRILGHTAARRVLVIGTEEQVDDFVDNLHIALPGMGRNTIVVNAQTVLAMTGVFEQHGETADVTLVAAHFGTRALGTVAGACGDVLLILSDGPEDIESAYTLLKKIAMLQGGAGIRIVVCGTRLVDSAMHVFGNLTNTVSQCLNIRTNFTGYFPEDRHVGLALSLGKPVASAFPASPSAMVFRQLTEEMLSWVNAEAQAGDGSAPSRVVMLARAPAQPVDESAQATSISVSTATLDATTRATELVY